MIAAIQAVECFSNYGLGLEEHRHLLDAPARNVLEDFKLQNYIKTNKTYMDKASALTLAVGSQVYHAAAFAEIERSEVGVIVGSDTAGLATSYAYAAKLANGQASPLLFANSFISTPSCLLAIEHKLKGVNSTLYSSHCSGLLALSQALEAIKQGQAQAVLSIGVDTLYNPPSLTSFTEGVVAIGLEAPNLRVKKPLAYVTGWVSVSCGESKLENFVEHLSSQSSHTGPERSKLGFYFNPDPIPTEFSDFGQTFSFTKPIGNLTGILLVALAATRLADATEPMESCLVVDWNEDGTSYGYCLERA